MHRMPQESADASGVLGLGWAEGLRANTKLTPFFRFAAGFVQLDCSVNSSRCPAPFLIAIHRHLPAASN